MFTTIIGLILLGVAITTVVKAVRIVPQQSVYIVERLGKYNGKLEAGLHFLVPFVDRVAYSMPLQEIPLETPVQTAVTKDNVSVELTAVLYFQVTDPESAAYGTADFEQAIELLARTTLRSEVGKRELDTLLQDRQTINSAVVSALDEAAATWGVKVLRYEVMEITPPESVMTAMQMQMTAEREKRARIARSEGQRTEEINLAEGKKAAAIAESEGEKQSAINRAEGEAAAVRAMASATADALNKVAEATQTKGGAEAIQLKVAERYVDAFANIAKQGTTVVVPANMSDLPSLITSAMSVVKGVGKA
jgi:regulator of protease activity HflC (stomatin/prohibitin superfamily)